MKNLKPFDLQAALSGKAVMLRDGRKAYARYHETELDVNADYKLLGYDADGDQLSWCENGDYFTGVTTSVADIVGMHPENRIINGFEVPAPETVAPERGTFYFVPNVLRCRLYDSFEWDGDGHDARALKRGLVFLSEEDAIATAKAMPGIDPHSETES